MAFNEFTVNNVRDFLEDMPSKGGFAFGSNLLFRGQADDIPLVPKLFRGHHNALLKSLGGWLKFESMLLTRFRSQAKPFIQNPPADTNELDWAVIGQHYGLPTRLLDWTENPLFALYFAVTSAKTEEGNSVVWAISGDAKMRVFLGSTDLSLLTVERDSVLNEYKIGRVYPEHLNIRVSSQQSCFTIHIAPREAESFVAIEALAQQESAIFTLQKAIIPVERRKPIQQQLYSMGVDSFTIFPDLSGLCQKLVWEIDTWQEKD